jgi:hypothetical protein
VETQLSRFGMSPFSVFMFIPQTIYVEKCLRLASSLSFCCAVVDNLVSDIP